MTPDPTRGLGPSHKINQGPVKGQKEQSVKATPPNSLGASIAACTTDNASKKFTSQHTWKKATSNPLKDLGNPLNRFAPRTKA
jgi:hypothetical protein